jgi:hypothetical protein
MVSTEILFVIRADIFQPEKISGLIHKNISSDIIDSEKMVIHSQLLINPNVLTIL